MRRSKGQSGAVPAPPDFPALGRIEALTELPIGDLRQAWLEAWSAPPPKGARRRLLMLGIAWKWQAAVHGGMPKPLERRLAALEAVARPEGATLGDLTAASGWLPHTTRAALTRLRQRGYDVRLADTGARRAYHLVPAE